VEIESILIVTLSLGYVDLLSFLLSANNLTAFRLLISLFDGTYGGYYSISIRVDSRSRDYVGFSIL
jgi:hypothetical protein